MGSCCMSRPFSRMERLSDAWSIGAGGFAITYSIARSTSQAFLDKASSKSAGVMEESANTEQRRSSGVIEYANCCTCCAAEGFSKAGSLASSRDQMSKSPSVDKSESSEREALPLIRSGISAC